MNSRFAARAAGEPLVAFRELQAKVGDVLVESRDFAVELVEVGGRAEPGIVAGPLAEQIGAATSSW